MNYKGHLGVSMLWICIISTIHHYFFSPFIFSIIDNYLFGFAISWICGMLPDLDVGTSYISKLLGFKIKGKHRGWTHTLIGYFVMCTPLVLFLWWLLGTNHILFYICCTVSYLLHIMADGPIERKKSKEVPDPKKKLK